MPQVLREGNGYFDEQTKRNIAWELGGARDERR
jgi:hypothetical protein